MEESKLSFESVTQFAESTTAERAVASRAWRNVCALVSRRHAHGAVPFNSLSALSRFASPVSSERRSLLWSRTERDILKLSERLGREEEECELRFARSQKGPWAEV